ncbi:MAG TPA: S-methyl-5'-thioadenosine phosphorylase [Thermodesulfovibrionales bacterium]|nr:S-methyl-5'-thioadenosine phosphorylase [Thermodesulfovibrionales bacterium]
MIGIIGGSGLYEIEGVTIRERRSIQTPFGDPSDAYLIGSFSEEEVVFLPRHGSQHAIPPHMINYRANIWGFRHLGVERIISIGATGGIDTVMAPGTMVVLDQIIDMTHGRQATFYDGGTGVVHIDLTEPYCPELRHALAEAGARTGLNPIRSGTYVCTNGPRLETRAEIEFYSQIGASVVGMTGMPEAALSREAEICYAGIAVVTNYAAGITGKKLTSAEVIEMMNRASLHLKVLLRESFGLIPKERNCPCKTALKDAGI